MIRPNIIVFTGPESSGKSYLAKKVARQFGLPLVNEFARDYIQQLKGPYVQSDLLKIAKGQYEPINRLSENDQWVILDTDALTIKIWSEEKYQSTHPEIIKLLDQNTVSHYLLCKPDIPWVFDPQRENNSDRERLFNIYLEELNARKENFTIVEGSFLKREQIAIDFFKKLFS